MNNMVSISLCMIVKDEEDTIERCLNSVKELCDEIIIVDTGSTDKTKELARRYTKKLFDFKWVHHFAKARNFAFSKATKDYILWLDADDVILKDDLQKLLLLKQTLDQSVDAVMMPYNLAFDSSGNVTFSSKRHRLVKRSRNFQWIGAVHEYLAVGGKIIRQDAAVTHRSTKTEKSDRNLKIYQQNLKDGKTFSPRDLYYYANECFDHSLYDEAIAHYEKFLKSGLGWIEDCISACDKLAEIFIRKNEQDKAIKAALRSFEYDLPRAEHCCKLGYIYLTQQNIDKAIFWYDLATKLDIQRAENTGGFVQKDYYTWIPHIQLCVCYDRIGNIEEAFEHNEKAREYAPTNPSVLYNKEYFEKRFSKN
ncbi:tetratricopeptide repeat-containing glycosyltransferase family 2 protein [Priestia endophytica]